MPGEELRQASAIAHLVIEERVLGLRGEIPPWPWPNDWTQAANRLPGLGCGAIPPMNIRAHADGADAFLERVNAGCGVAFSAAAVMHNEPK
jgi:hypothetical protein